MPTRDEAHWPYPEGSAWFGVSQGRHKMQSGLFGIPELHTGRGFGTTPDYLHQCLSPVDVDADLNLIKLAQSRKGSRRRPGVGATANELGNNHARVLVDALSSPELIQILTKWHIRDPSGIPYSRRLPRNQLLDLVVQHDEALAEVIRLVTPAIGQRGVLAETKSKTQKPKLIKIQSERVASGGYRSILNMYSSIHNQPPATTTTKRQEPARRRAESATPVEMGQYDIDSLSAMSYDLRTGGKKADPKTESRKNDWNCDEKQHSDSHGRSASDLDNSNLRQSRRKYHLLKSQLQQTRREREECSMLLAQKGLLGFALDSDMNKPITIGKGLEVETVKRNLEITGGFHINKFSKDLTGVYVDPIKVEQSLIPPQMRTLCL